MTALQSRQQACTFTLHTVSLRSPLIIQVRSQQGSFIPAEAREALSFPAMLWLAAAALRTRLNRPSLYFGPILRVSSITALCQDVTWAALIALTDQGKGPYPGVSTAGSTPPARMLRHSGLTDAGKQEVIKHEAATSLTCMSPHSLCMMVGACTVCISRKTTEMQAAMYHALHCRGSISPERSRSPTRGSRASSTSTSSERWQAHSARRYLAAHGYQPHTLEEFRAQGYDAKRERYWTLGTLGADVDTAELQVANFS